MDEKRVSQSIVDTIRATRDGPDLIARLAAQESRVSALVEALGDYHRGGAWSELLNAHLAALRAPGFDPGAAALTYLLDDLKAAGIGKDGDCIRTRLRTALDALITARRERDEAIADWYALRQRCEAAERERDTYRLAASRERDAAFDVLRRWKCLAKFPTDGTTYLDGCRVLLAEIETLLAGTPPAPERSLCPHGIAGPGQCRACHDPQDAEDSGLWWKVKHDEAQAEIARLRARIEAARGLLTNYRSADWHTIRTAWLAEKDATATLERARKP